MLRLRIHDDEGQRSDVPVQVDEITIGRDRANTICLPERNVSRRHVRLVRDNGHVVVEDAGSSYGTQVNGARIDSRAVLRVGDSLRVGDYEIELLDDVRAAATADSPQPRQPLIPAEHRGRLVITSSPLGGRELLLDRTPMTVGRSETADHTIEHRSVSAMHVRIEWSAAEGYIVEDLDSANGVHVNGESYKRVSLRAGDAVELGHVRLRFVGPGEAYEWTPSADEDTLPSGSGKKALFAVIAVALVALVAVYFLVFDRSDTPDRVSAPSNEATGPSGRSGETDKPGTEPVQVAAAPAQKDPAAGEAPQGEASKTAMGEPGAGEQQVAVVQPPVEIAKEPVKEPVADPVEVAVAPGEGPADWMTAAGKAAEEQDWGRAIALLEKVKAAEPANQEAESKLLSARVEQERAGRIAEVEKKVTERNYAAAWSKVNELHDTASASVYFEKIKELHGQVRTAYIDDYLAKAEKDIKAGNLDQANGLLSAVLGVDPSNVKGKTLKKTVVRRQKELVAEAKAREEKKETAAVKQPEKQTEKQDTAAKADTKKGEGARLYHEGRTAKIQGNLGLAVDRFNAAAKSGYADAHKQLGVIYASQGKAPQAIDHYGQYLRKKPGAPDADAVRTAIERLGGSP